MASDDVCGHTAAMESEPATKSVPGWADPAAPGPAPARPDPPPSQLIGRAEREQADQHLRWALAEDVLTIGEFDDRLGLVLRARTRSDLDAILADLPRPTALPQPQAPLRPTGQVIAVMGGEERRGRWRPGRPVRLVALMGGVVADLREAETHDGVFDVDAVAVMGGVELVVPENANVDLGGFAIMGGRDNKVPPTASSDGPVVRVNGYALMGGVVIRTATKRERKRHPVDEVQATPQPPFAPAREIPPRRRSWVGRIIGIGLLAALALGPGRAIVTADAKAIFGSANYTPSAEELSGKEPVDVFALFGGIDVVIPETHRARLDGLALFGGTSCEVVCDSDRTGPDVEVDAMAIFGGVDVNDGTEQDD